MNNPLASTTETPTASGARRRSAIEAGITNAYAIASALGPGIACPTHSSTWANATKNAATMRSSVAPLGSRCTSRKLVRRGPSVICRTGDIARGRSPAWERRRSARRPTTRRRGERSFGGVIHHPLRRTRMTAKLHPRLLVPLASVAAAAALVAGSAGAQTPPSTLHLVAKNQRGVGFQPAGRPHQGSRFGFGDRVSGDDTGYSRAVCTLL